jgi:hypothetical protein
MLTDDNGISCFVDNLGVTCWVDDLGQTLCCGGGGPVIIMGQACLIERDDDIQDRPKSHLHRRVEF